MTQQERETHREATKLRKMTDQQLVDYVNSQKEQAGPAKDQEPYIRQKSKSWRRRSLSTKQKPTKRKQEARKNAENAVKPLRAKHRRKAAVEAIPSRS